TVAECAFARSKSNSQRIVNKKGRQKRPEIIKE
ncbi:hydrogenase maturation nickel metallochaperone HypA, partial [Salmonella enterica]|nr:hydrogenase maturation nickel metallochaperone HypA [Salmonella enterica]